MSKILLSAYACEPNRGSESGVGWNWALELARLGHEVWVLTRGNNRPVIEPVTCKLAEKGKLHFLYYDLPWWASWWKRGGQGVHLYYFLWQWCAYRFAREVHARERFDLVHHVTFVTVRQPSFMGNLGIPFILGPVAGGEKAPWRLRIGYGAKGWFLDALRDLANLLVKFDPFMWQTFRKAEKIYVTSEQTKKLIPQKYRVKSEVLLAIGWQGEPINVCRETRPEAIRVLYVGRFLYWKGMHLGLKAFAKLVEGFPDARLTMVGQGPDEQNWRELSECLGLQDNIEWIPWVRQGELKQLYLRHDVFLFPSLHDSGGMVVLEAMAHGLPVICLDLGGPGVMMDNECGRVVETEGKDERQVVEELQSALFALATNLGLRQKCSVNAMEKVAKHSWSALVRDAYSEANCYKYLKGLVS